MILKNFERQALHAYHLGFEHPISKKRMNFDVELPEDFRNLIVQNFEFLQSFKFCECFFRITKCLT